MSQEEQPSFNLPTHINPTLLNKLNLTNLQTNLNPIFRGQNFRPIFWRPKFFGTQILPGPEISWHKFFQEPNFFLTYNFSGPKIFMEPKFFWDLIFWYYPYFFGIKKCLNTNFFGQKFFFLIFFDKIFFTKIILVTKFYLGANIFETKNFFGP